MKTGLLLCAAEVVVGVAVGGMVVGAADAWAACIPTNDCAELGYKYSSSECSGSGVACPFDTTKFFCFEPQICNYTITAATCSSQCKNVGSKSCIKNGVTYYESCGTSMCSSSQTCENGTCKSNVVPSGKCCGYSGCSEDEEWCKGSYGIGCVEHCRRYGFPYCSDMRASCSALGKTSRFVMCYHPSGGYNNTHGDTVAYFSCQ